MFNTPLFALSTVVLALSLAGCAVPRMPACASGQEAVKSEWLYFGTKKSDEGSISAIEWEEFLRIEVVSRFPEGFTVYEARGQWKGKTGEMISERSYVLNVVHPGTPKHVQAFSELITLYKHRFSQESVLQVSTAACATF